ncbi:Hypothetical predicted protein, partial [Pelobates cultripes]
TSCADSRMAVSISECAAGSLRRPPGTLTDPDSCQHRRWGRRPQGEYSPQSVPPDRPPGGTDMRPAAAILLK